MCLHSTGFHLNPHPGPVRSAPLIAFQIRPELHSSVCVCVRACVRAPAERQTDAQCAQRVERGFVAPSRTFSSWTDGFDIMGVCLWAVR
ncbi:hypothetical protein IRJ41_012319 [Triplophysa rosa]|uniref:Uncharacterized protein n=1 Tax=Triplophysa rosa TaxID=992332 RepID=A0A9W7TD55_TRIRA|nr:hypothetical protein IRJ41_012319 [Triplophysa rosa]